MIRNLTIPVLLTMLFVSISCNNHIKAEEDFVLLFNGQNLDGWVNVNCAPETWSVKEGMIVCTGIPTGILRTDKQYENFILELEWKHLHKDGNAGLFIHSDDITARGKPFSRSVECQIMDGNHGDVFAIHGASMTRDNEDPFYRIGWMRTFPREERANPYGEWNHYRIESREGILTLAVNGEIVSRAFHVNPRKGYICLESEGSEVHFKNIRIKELPGSAPLPENTAYIDRGYQPLYNGLDLRGWTEEGGKQFWKPDNWTLICEGDSTKDNGGILWTTKEYGDFNLIIDWRFTGEPLAWSVPVILPDGSQAEGNNSEKITVPIRYAGEGKIFIRGSEENGVYMTSWPEGSGGLSGYRETDVFDPDNRKLATPIIRADKVTGEWNRFEVIVKNNLVSVILNDKAVIKEARMPNPSETGSIGILVSDYPMEFANIYIKEL